MGRVFCVAYGGRTCDGRKLNGFGLMRIGPLIVTVLGKWVRWPIGLRFACLRGITVVRWGCLVISWRTTDA